MFTHTLNRSWSRAGEAINKTFNVTGGAEINIDEAIPAATTDQLVAFTADVSQIKSLFIVSDKDVLIQTNSGSSAVNTFTLAAGRPFMWSTGDAALADTEGDPVTTDITALYVTNAHETAAAALQIRCLVDPTV